MYTDDLHEATFIWPRTDAQIVVLTGSFDNWSKTFCLAKGPNGFYGTIRIPWNTLVTYKYLVDGKWSLDNAKPKRVEPEGYVNNVYAAPPKPFLPTIYETNPAQPHLNGSMNGIKTVGHKDESTVPAGATTEKASASEINGHVDIGKSQQDVPPQGAKEAEGAHAVTPVLADGHQGNGAATTGQEVVAGAKAVEEKEGDSHPSLPTQQPAEATTPEQPEKSTSTTVNQGVSQLVAKGHDANASSKKPTLIGPFVPVNSTHEIPVTGGSGSQDNSSAEISTHKPLGPVSKPPRSPSEDAVGAPQTAEAGDEQASKGSTDGTLVPHTGGNGESSAGAEGKPPAGHCAEPFQTESPTDQADQKPPPLATPAKDAKESIPSGPSPAKLAEKSPSAPASPTKPRFPRFSRDSSSSEPSHIGTPRRRKSTIIEKIKHIFSNEKQKLEKHKK